MKLRISIIILEYQKHEEYFSSVNTTISYSFEDITEETKKTSNGFGILVFTTAIGTVLMVKLKRRL